VSVKVHESGHERCEAVVYNLFGRVLAQQVAARPYRSNLALANEHRAVLDMRTAHRKDVARE